MKITVGSTNPNKVQAVIEVASEYDFLKNAKVNGIAVNSGVSKQPITLAETIDGATNRARAAFTDCDLSIGLEDGLMPVPHTKTGYMNIGACVICEGAAFHLGLSPGFEYPPTAVRLVIDKKIEIDDAFKAAGLTTSSSIGKEQGAIGLLTNGKITRKEYQKQSIRMAMIHLQNKELYTKNP